MAKTLFDKLYDATEEFKDKLKKPLIVKQVKRKFESAIDDCDDKVIDLERQLQEARENVRNLDVNTLLKLRQKIAELKVLKDELLEEQKNLFAEVE